MAGAESIDPQIFRFMFVRSRALDWYVKAAVCLFVHLMSACVRENQRERNMGRESSVSGGKNNRSCLKINYVLGLFVFCCNVYATKLIYVAIYV